MWAKVKIRNISFKSEFRFEFVISKLATFVLKGPMILLNDELEAYDPVGELVTSQ